MNSEKKGKKIVKSSRLKLFYSMNIDKFYIAHYFRTLF